MNLITNLPDIAFEYWDPVTHTTSPLLDLTPPASLTSHIPFLQGDAVILFANPTDPPFCPSSSSL